jgi:hypothetical protein
MYGFGKVSNPGWIEATCADGGLQRLREQLLRLAQTDSMLRQMQPMAAVPNDLLSRELFNRETPHRIGHVRRGHPTQAPAVNPGLIGVLGVKLAQDTRRATQQFLPMCGENYEALAGSLDDLRSRRNGDVCRCAFAQANQILHPDALGRLSQQGLNPIAREQLLKGIETGDAIGNATVAQGRRRIENHTSPDGMSGLRIAHDECIACGGADRRLE